VAFFPTCAELILDADLVCSRAKNHYDPQGTLDFSDSTSHSQTAAEVLASFKQGYQDLHPAQARLMYFTVSCSRATLLYKKS
jgi:hypothetical protein